MFTSFSIPVYKDMTKFSQDLTIFLTFFPGISKKSKRTFYYYSYIFLNIVLVTTIHITVNITIIIIIFLYFLFKLQRNYLKL